jgi:hypothetical protein
MHIMEFVKIITYETVVALGGQRAHNEWMIKYLRFPTLTHRTHLLNYLRFYWTTWEFTELPQNLLNYLTIYWTTWEFTKLPHNLLNYRQFYTTPPNISFVGILLGWPFKTPKSLGWIPTVTIPNPGQPPLEIFLTQLNFNTKMKLFA